MAPRSVSVFLLSNDILRGPLWELVYEGWLSSPAIRISRRVGTAMTYEDTTKKKEFKIHVLPTNWRTMQFSWKYCQQFTSQLLRHRFLFYLKKAKNHLLLGSQFSKTRIIVKNDLIKTIVTAWFKVGMVIQLFLINECDNCRAQFQSELSAKILKF